MTKDKEVYLIIFMIFIIVISLFSQVSWKKKEACPTIKCKVEKYLDKSEKLDACKLKKLKCVKEMHEYEISMWKMDKALMEAE